MWEEVVPIDQNGVITMYEVLYVPLETFGGAIGPLAMNVTELTANRADLEGAINYSISVRAYTSVGAGPYSDPVIELVPETSKCCFTVSCSYNSTMVNPVCTNAAGAK